MGQLGKGRDEMKKFLAMTLVVMMTLAAGFAQTSKHATTSEAFVNKAQVAQAASTIKAKPALISVNPVAGYLPVFTDAAGDISNSSFFQAANGYVGIGTTTPAFNLNIISETDPAAVTVEGYGVVGVNFIGRRARGTVAAPSALLANDNIMAMQGRGFGTTGFSTSSRAFMKFFAAENWTDTAQGTYISLATTQIGTIPAGGSSAPERVRITDIGWVGIGTTAPAAMLEVSGTTQLDGLATFAAGQVFPGTVTSVTSDGSITVGGTATAPILSVNPVTLAAEIGAGGTAVSVPVIVAQTSITGGSGTGTPTTIYTATASGFYRVSVYENTPVPLGSCTSAPCTGEGITLKWNDGASTASLATTNCDLTAPCSSSSVTPIWVVSGQSITAYGQTTGAGGTPVGGSFNAYILVERLQK
jgi:hypothetical protein